MSMHVLAHARTHTHTEAGGEGAEGLGERI